MRKAGANNQENRRKEVKVNTTKTRQTFKVKQEIRETKDRGVENTNQMKKKTKAACHAQPNQTESHFQLDQPGVRKV